MNDCYSCLIQETDHRPHDLLDSLCPDLCAISYPQPRIPYYALRTLHLSLPSPQLAIIPWHRLPTLPVPSSTTGICPVSTSAYQIYRLIPSLTVSSSRCDCSSESSQLLSQSLFYSNLSSFFSSLWHHWYFQYLLLELSSGHGPLEGRSKLRAGSFMGEMQQTFLKGQ